MPMWTFSALLVFEQQVTPDGDESRTYLCLPREDLSGIPPASRCGRVWTIPRGHRYATGLIRLRSTAWFRIRHEVKFCARVRFVARKSSTRQSCAEPLPRDQVSGVIESRLTVEKRAEQAIKEEECDPKILVHQTSVIDHPMMHFMQITRRHEPPFEKPVPRHPKAFDMLHVMKIAEHEKTPTKRHAEKDELVQRPNV